MCIRDRFADRFGANTADIAKLTAWLQGQGFSIGHVSRGRRWIVFHGDAGKVRSSFHTNIHRYRSNGEMHYANSGDPVIPGVLTDLVSSIGGCLLYTSWDAVSGRGECGGHC